MDGASGRKRCGSGLWVLAPGLSSCGPGDPIGCVPTAESTLASAGVRLSRTHSAGADGDRHEGRPRPRRLDPPRARRAGPRPPAVPDRPGGRGHRRRPARFGPVLAGRPGVCLRRADPGRPRRRLDRPPQAVPCGRGRARRQRPRPHAPRPLCRVPPWGRRRPGVGRRPRRAWESRWADGEIALESDVLRPVRPCPIPSVGRPCCGPATTAGMRPCSPAAGSGRRTSPRGRRPTRWSSRSARTRGVNWSGRGGRRPAFGRPPCGADAAWWVALVAFFTAIGAAGFRSTPGVLITPLHDEFGWPVGVIGLAVSVNLVLFGLTAPFSAALMERFGIRRVVACALVLVSVGSILPIWMTASWQLDPLLGPARRAGHRGDVDVAGGRRHRTLVRGAARPGQRRAHRGRGHRAAAVPAVPRVAGREPRVALRGDRDGDRCPARRPAGALAVPRPPARPGPHRLRSTGRRAGEHQGAAALQPGADGRRRAADRQPAGRVLAARRVVRGLRRLHQRAGRDPLHPRRARPRDAADHGRRRCSRSSGSSTSSGRSSRGG